VLCAICLRVASLLDYRLRRSADCGNLSLFTLCTSPRFRYPIPHPEVGVTFDTDAAAAVATRRRILDMVATDKLLVAGMHLHFPGFSHVVRSGATYALLPEVYRLEVKCAALAVLERVGSLPVQSIAS
jgi:hypothetical protein